MLRPSARSLSITSQESYSAVMITDLVADVPVTSETDHEMTRPKREETNLAYDDCVDDRAKSSDMELKTNGASISRGVILNAMQFGQNDTKTKIDEKSMQLSVPTVTQQTSVSKRFKDMSIQRKIAFVFSFLPSIFFVLCFAVILPCNVPKPCVEEGWISVFNNTEATSRLEISENIMLTALKNGESVLMELQSSNGKSKERKISANSAHLKCGDKIYKNKTDCIITDKYGIYTLEDSESKILWKPQSNTDTLPSSPVFLSGCSGDVKDIAVAISSSNVVVLNGENQISNFAISLCDSVPVKLTAWTINGSSDIVFVCEKDGKDRLVKIPKNVWCASSKTSREQPFVLQTGSLDSIKNSIIEAFENDSLVLWSGNDATMLKPDGDIQWKVSNLSHLAENRFILHGNFHGGNKELAFLSSNILSGLKVTLLDPSSGSIVYSANYENIEASEVKYLSGKKRDFVLLLLKKLKTASGIISNTLTQINDISTTVVSLVSNEKFNEDTPNTMIEELALLDLDGDLNTVIEINESKKSNHKSSVTAIHEKETDILKLYILSTYQKSQMKLTEVRNVNVANWDKSTKSKCLAKY